MKTKQLILIYFTAFLLFGGCKPKQMVNNSNSVQRNDSIVYVSVRDTFIKYPPQLQAIKTNQKSKLATDFSFSIAWIDSVGLLNHSIQNFPVIPSKVIEKKTEIKKYKHETQTITITVTKKETKYIHKYRIFSYFDFIILGLVLSYFVFRLLKVLKIA